MKVSILGPSYHSLSKIIGKSIEKIDEVADEIGEVLAKNKCKAVIVFDLRGVRTRICNSYRKHGGKLEMLYTTNDYDWDTKDHMKYLKKADIKTKMKSWHDLLLSLVKDSDVILCAGISTGVVVELGYLKWSYREGKSKTKVIGIKELLKNGRFPEEVEYDLKDLITVIPVKDLDKTLKKLRK